MFARSLQSVASTFNQNSVQSAKNFLNETMCLRFFCLAVPSNQCLLVIKNSISLLRTFPEKVFYIMLLYRNKNNFLKILYFLRPLRRRWVLWQKMPEGTWKTKRKCLIWKQNKPYNWWWQLHLVLLFNYFLHRRSVARYFHDKTFTLQDTYTKAKEKCVKWLQDYSEHFAAWIL